MERLGAGWRGYLGMVGRSSRLVGGRFIQQPLATDVGTTGAPGVKATAGVADRQKGWAAPDSVGRVDLFQTHRQEVPSC